MYFEVEFLVIVYLHPLQEVLNGKVLLRLYGTIVHYVVECRHIFAVRIS